jgi:glycosyltransferase involved in cell wall biosynthesis
MSLSIVVPSVGRPALAKALNSIALQVQAGDEILVDINNDQFVGNGARQRTMMKARGSHICFLDDDDEYAPGALDAIRAAVEEHPSRILLFRMKFCNTDNPSFPQGTVLWADPEVRESNVATEMVVVPNIPQKLGTWGRRYAGDYDFIHTTCVLHDEPPVFVDHVTVLYNLNH